MITNKTISRRAQLLSGVGLALLAVAPANAGTTTVRDNTVDSNPAFTRDYNRVSAAYQSINPLAINDEQVSATVTVSGGVTHTNTTTVAGTPIASTNTINTNTIVAQATGNTITNTASLLALDANPEQGDGIAMLGTALNTRDIGVSDGYVTSLALDSSIASSLTNRPTDTANVDGNTIAARTNVNVASSVVSGQVPNTYSSTTSGAATLDPYAYSYETEAVEGIVYENKLSSVGSIVASTLQISEPSRDSWSKASGNQIELDLLSTAYQAQSGTGTLDDNTIAATFAGNTSTSTINIEGGANPTFTGSAVVATSQINSGNEAEDGEVSASNLSSLISARVWGDIEGEGWTNNLTGSLSVNNNAITAAATGNLSTGNLISLDDAMNVAGTSANAEGRVDNAEGRIEANGTLVIAASQLNDSDAYFEGQTSALTANATIIGEVQEIIGGSLVVSGNSITATSNGNKYGAEISTSELVNEINGGVVVATQQMSANESNVWATATQSAIRANVGDGGFFFESTFGEVSAASVSLTENTITAAAYGNQGDNAISLDATTLNGSFLAAADLEAYTEGWVNPIGSVVLGSSQTNRNSYVTARNIDALVELNSFDYEGTDRTTLLVSENQQEAIAVGNLVDNAIDVSATTTGSGIGIASGQGQFGGSNVTAAFDGTMRVFIAEDLGETGASTLSLIDNTQRAVAYANSATNDLSVSATTANIAANGSNASVVEESAYASVRSISAFGVLNNQFNEADVTATTLPLQNGYSNFEVYVGLDVEDGSTIRNDGNSVIAAANGSSAMNSATVAVNTLDVIETEAGNYAPLSSVASGQYLDGESTITAQVSPDGDAAILTYVEEDFRQGASISTSSNTLLAQALGNTVENSLAVQSTTISSFGDGGRLWHDGESYADAALSINNVQDARGGEGVGEVRATLRTNFGTVTEGTASVEIRSVVDEGDISNASLVSLGNALTATAGTNRAVNVLDLSATGLQASVGVNNLQETSNVTLASMGVEGTAGTPAGNPQTFTYTATITNINASLSGGVYTINSATASVPLSSLTAEQQAYLEANGWSVSGTDLVGTPPAGVIGLALNFDQYANYLGSTQTLSGSIPGTPATAGTAYSGGVFAYAGEDITNSTIRVDGNKATGTAIGNDAANSVTVVATTVRQSSTFNQAYADTSETNADVSLLNGQAAYNTQTAEVINTFAIEQESNNSISSSLLSVSGNRQSATAVGNVADNALSLTATDLSSDPTTTALASRQYSDSNVDAYSVMQVYAPVQSSSSTITLNGNSNSALGVKNDVANSLTVEGTNIASNSGIDATSAAFNGSAADNALYNEQTAYGTLDTVARSNIFNQDYIDPDTTGVVNGTVEMNGNMTLAESSANRAANTLTVNGTANQGSTSALGNHQQSFTSVAASATSTVGTNLVGTGTMTSASTVSVDGNVTQALARGNTATNSLTTAAGATYPAVGGIAGSTNTAASANAVLVNAQNNFGGVSASANNTTYTVVLNSGLSPQAVTNSTVNVNNNRVTAVAYGNQATNVLTLNALNSGLPTSAIASSQLNTGAVVATASNVTFGFNSASGVTNASTIRANANAVTASAVGNSVVSSIIAQ